MFKWVCILLFACALFGCTEEEPAPTRRQVCTDFCEQRQKCQPSWIEFGFGDVPTCVEACDGNVLPSECTASIPNSCAAARFARWACVAGLSCNGLLDFWDGKEDSGWELVEDADGTVHWAPTEIVSYKCRGKDVAVLEECVMIDWDDFSSDCGYNDGDDWTNYYDLEFDDF